MTEKETMLAGLVYDAVNPELQEGLQATKEALYEFNMLRPSETQRMKEILKGLLGSVGDDNFLINQPFLGHNFYRSLINKSLVDCLVFRIFTSVHLS